MDEVKRVDYEPVGMVSAAPGGARWYHQHFSVSKDPFRLTAWFGPHNPGRIPARRREGHRLHRMDIPEGGTSFPTGWRTLPSARNTGKRSRRAACRTEWTRLVRPAGQEVVRLWNERGSGGGPSSATSGAASRPKTRYVSPASGSISFVHFAPGLLASGARRLDDRYVVSERKVVHESEVLLTPFVENAADGTTIDAAALGPSSTGNTSSPVSIPGDRHRRLDPHRSRGPARQRPRHRRVVRFTGREVRLGERGRRARSHPRRFRIGACARSIRESVRVMNVDIGGGTSRSPCARRATSSEMTAADIGARIVSFDSEGRVKRIEEAGRRFSAEVGLVLEMGARPDAILLDAMVERMAVFCSK